MMQQIAKGRDLLLGLVWLIFHQQLQWAGTRHFEPESPSFQLSNQDNTL